MYRLPVDGAGNKEKINNNKRVLSQRHAPPTLSLCPWSKTSYESHLFDQPPNSSVSRPATRDESSLQPRQRHCSKTTTTRARSTDLKIRSTTTNHFTQMNHSDGHCCFHGKQTKLGPYSITR